MSQYGFHPAYSMKYDVSVKTRNAVKLSVCVHSCNTVTILYERTLQI